MSLFSAFVLNLKQMLLLLAETWLVMYILFILLSESQNAAQILVIIFFCYVGLLLLLYLQIF